MCIVYWKIIRKLHHILDLFDTRDAVIDMWPFYLDTV